MKDFYFLFFFKESVERGADWHCSDGETTLSDCCCWSWIMFQPSAIEMTNVGKKVKDWSCCQDEFHLLLARLPGKWAGLLFQTQWGRKSGSHNKVCVKKKKKSRTSRIKRDCFVSRSSCAHHGARKRIQISAPYFLVWQPTKLIIIFTLLFLNIL